MSYTSVVNPHLNRNETLTSLTTLSFLPSLFPLNPQPPPAYFPGLGFREPDVALSTHGFLSQDFRKGYILYFSSFSSYRVIPCYNILEENIVFFFKSIADVDTLMHIHILFF